MTAELPPLDPTVAAAALELLPPRLQKRAEKLAADTSEWEINTDNGLSVTMGQATVTQHDPQPMDIPFVPEDIPPGKRLLHHI